MFPALFLATAVAIGFFLMPLAWSLRAWVLVAFILLWTATLVPIIPWQYEGLFAGLGYYLAVWLLGLASVGIVVRGLRTKAEEGETPESKRALQGIDAVLAALFGLWAGCMVTLLLAATLRGLSGGLGLHLAVSVAAFLTLAVARRFPMPLKPFAISGLLTLGCLTMAGGIFYPRLITEQAKLVGPNTSRCLRTPDGNAPTIDELRLLTLPDARPFRPSLILTIASDRDPRYFRWSYRALAFMPYDSYDGGPCLSP